LAADFIFMLQARDEKSNHRPIQILVFRFVFARLATGKEREPITGSRPD
jgi:hypothetical protein